MSRVHTKFELAHVNELLNHYHQENDNINLPKSVSSYADFVEKIPIKYDSHLREDALKLLSHKKLDRCSFTLSSATSNAHKILAQRIWRSVTPDSYPHQLVATLLRFGVFNTADVVANLFSAGGMSMLYDGCNRLLEGCKTSIVPIGRLDANPHLITTFLNVMKETKVNTLFGTPSSFLQCAAMCYENNINLDIKKIVFTGEMFSDIKRSYVRQVFPEIQIYGLYGHSETGFVGVTTPRCEHNYYHLLSNFFFIETTENGEVLITDLTKPSIPMFRYYVGDIGELITEANACSCGSHLPIILLKGRCDKKFNYMGNLVSYEKIKKIVIENYDNPIDIQIQLSTNDSGHDLLNIVVDDDNDHLDLIRDKIVNDLIILEEISEGIAKRTGTLAIRSRDNFILSYRQKLPLILDNR